MVAITKPQATKGSRTGMIPLKTIRRASAEIRKEWGAEERRHRWELAQVRQIDLLGIFVALARDIHNHTQSKANNT